MDKTIRLQTTSESASPTPEMALAMFASADTDPQLRSAALSALIAAKILPKQADSDPIRVGREILLSQAAASGFPAHRLLAIAECIRLSQVVKRWSSEVEQRLRPAFSTELPAMQLLSNADDRLNVARACALMSAEWMNGYLAHSIAHEDTGEKARSEMVAALFAKSASLADAFRVLGDAFATLRPVTEAPGDTVARRLTRTLNALREAILQGDIEVGEHMGEALRALVAGPLSAVGRPPDEKVQIELSREALLVVHDVVRTRISVVTEPEVYRVVEFCRKLNGGGSWPNELKVPLERLITNVTEALVLLGRQGQCDQGLLAQLNVLCNFPERARAVASDLAARHPELPEEVREWLRRGRTRVTHQPSSSAIEAAASTADESIGLALFAARQARLLRDSLSMPLASNLEIYEPTLVVPTKALLERIQVLAVQMEHVAGIRGLDLYGTVDEEMEVSPKFFVVVGNSPRQRMVVKQPAVVRRRSDGTIGDVVSKGLVE